MLIMTAFGTTSWGQSDIPTSTHQNIQGTSFISKSVCDITIERNRERTNGLYGEPTCGYIIKREDISISELLEIRGNDTVSVDVTNSQFPRPPIFYSDEDGVPDKIIIFTSPIINPSCGTVVFHASDFEIPESCFNGVKDPRERWVDCGCECGIPCEEAGVFPLAGPSRIFLEGAYDASSSRMITNDRLQFAPDTLWDYYDPNRNDNGSDLNDVVDVIRVSYLAENLECLPGGGVESFVTENGRVFGQTIDNIQVLPLDSTEFFILVDHDNHSQTYSISPVPVRIYNGAYPSVYYTQYNFVSDGGFPGMKYMNGNNQAIFAGDANQDGDINGADKLIWFNTNGISGQYLPGDFNLDGDVNGADKIFWVPNNGTFLGRKCD